MIDEEAVREIVKEVLGKLWASATPSDEGVPIPVGVSNRHVHVSREDLDVLFGPGHELKVMRDLSQPGQFAAQETVTLVGPKGVIQGVRILGPVRKKTQAEISRTDAFALGLTDVPVRESGDLTGTPGISMVGPAGAVTLKEGVIIAARHLHAAPRDAVRLGVKDGDRVRVRIPGPRAVVFEEVVVRVRDDFSLEVHLDFDEANAALFSQNMQGKLI